MRSDNRAWLERLNLVERSNPLLSVLRMRLSKIQMNIVVSGIASNHEPDRRNMETGRMVRVGVTKFHNHQRIPFEVDHIPFELFRDHQFVRNLARKSRLPGAVERLWGGVLSHHLDCIGRRYYFGVRESIEKCANSKPMVSVAVGNIDGC